MPVPFSVIDNYRTTLRTSMTSVQNTIPVTSVTTTDGHVITMPDLGAEVFLVIEPGGINMEIIQCTGVTNAPPTWTGATRGLAFFGQNIVSVPANQKTHNAGVVVIMTNAHYVYNRFVDKEGDELVSGKKTFLGDLVNRPTLTLDLDSGVLTDLVTVGQLNRTAILGAPFASLVQAGLVQLGTTSDELDGVDIGVTGAYNMLTANDYITHKAEHINKAIQLGEAVVALNILYLDNASGKFKIAHANVQAEVDAVEVVAYENGVLNDFKRKLLPGSIVFGDVGLTPGGIVYLSDLGRASAAPGTIRKVIGLAEDANTWIFNPTVDTPTATPTANRIPIADATGSLRNWIGEDSLNIQTYVAGEIINAALGPLALYLKEADGRVYLLNASAVTEAAFAFIGFAIVQPAVALGGNVLVQTDGRVLGFAGLTIGGYYYNTNVAGAINTVAGTNSLQIGRAITATELLIQVGKKVTSGTGSFNATLTTTFTTGFKPVRMTVTSTLVTGGIGSIAWGTWDTTGGNNCIMLNNTNNAGAAIQSVSNVGQVYVLNDTAGNVHQAIVQNITSNSFDLANTKINAPGAVHFAYTVEG